MNLTERFATLTPEQREKFYTIKDSAGLDAFLTETGLELTADEKEQVTEFITSGKQPLSDDELNAVAGGQDPNLVAFWKRQAESEGRGTHVGMSVAGLFNIYSWRDARCPICKVEGSVFSASKGEVTSSSSILYQDFYDVKCYACNTSKALGFLSSASNLGWK